MNSQWMHDSSKLKTKIPRPYLYFAVNLTHARNRYIDDGSNSCKYVRDLKLGSSTT